jgi:hypothetical protein
MSTDPQALNEEDRLYSAWLAGDETVVLDGDQRVRFQRRLDGVTDPQALVALKPCEWCGLEWVPCADTPLIKAAFQWADSTKVGRESGAYGYFVRAFVAGAEHTHPISSPPADAEALARQTPMFASKARGRVGRAPPSGKPDLGPAGNQGRDVTMLDDLARLEALLAKAHAPVEAGYTLHERLEASDAIVRAVPDLIAAIRATSEKAIVAENTQAMVDFLEATAGCADHVCSTPNTRLEIGSKFGAQCRQAAAQLRASHAQEAALTAAINQNDAMRQELAHVGNLVSDLARAMGVDQANDDGSWPDLAGRIGKLVARATALERQLEEARAVIADARRFVGITYGPLTVPDWKALLARLDAFLTGEPA